MLLNHEIEFTLLLAIEVEQVMILPKAVGIEFLSHKILKHRAIVDIGVLLQQSQLDIVAIHSRQEADIIEEKLEQIALLVKQQGQFGLLDIVSGEGYTSILQPQEAALIATKTSLFIQLFENKSLVLGIEFRGNQVVNILYQQFPLGADDVSLFAQNPSKIICV